MLKKTFSGFLLATLFGTWGCDNADSVQAPNTMPGSNDSGTTSASGTTSTGDTTSTDSVASTTTGGSPLAECSLPERCEPGPDSDPGAAFEPTPPEALSAEVQGVEALLASARALDAAGLFRDYPAVFSNGLSYTPGEAAGIDLLQSTSLALVDSELERLNELGFVITDKTSFPNFVYGYEMLYTFDLPLFVSADSVLFALHQSYDSILADVEITKLVPALTRILSGLRAQLQQGVSGGYDDSVIKDIDLYLTVAQRLLTGTDSPTLAGASDADVDCLLAGITAGDGCVLADLFGTSRVFDFSQFTVRGHYTDSPVLGRYFQAMMWLGRIDFRLIETRPNHSQVFRRRQLEGALLLRDLIDASSSRADWQLVDNVVSAFLGQHDSMTLDDMDALLGDLGATTIVDLDAVPDEVLANTMVAGGYGAQRISSHIMVNAAEGGTLPLSSSFLLFGQRYLVDSHVFSNTVYDRVQPGPGYEFRVMPNPLDAAFAAMGNNQAAALLEPELDQFGYAPELASMRTLIDALPEDYWQADLYNRLLSSLRSLSPNGEQATPSEVGLPEVAGSEAWGRRLLNTQLASWSELRHDTLLYAKQSYTAGFTVCEYPDAYVDPYPAFWRGLIAFAEHGANLVGEHGLSTSVRDYFQKVIESLTILAEMAENQRQGLPHSEAQIAFINRAVRTFAGGGGCGGDGANAVDAEGWYADLFFDPADRVSYDPTIADVHTQPTDTSGMPAGRVLHVATGTPRQIVVTANTCEGPKAYVGLVSSYFERITENFERLTDERWAQEIYVTHPEDVAWMQALVVR